MSGFWLKMGVYLALVGYGYYFFLFFNAKYRPNYDRHRRIVFTVITFPFLGALAALIINAVIPVYYLEPYKGKVVEAETGRPVEGAGVLMLYRVNTFSIHGTRTSYIDFQETSTSKDGEYRIPGKWKLDFNKTPYGEINIFKPGYTYKGKVYHHFLSGKPRYWNSGYEIFELNELTDPEERFSNLLSAGAGTGLEDDKRNRIKYYKHLLEIETENLRGKHGKKKRVP